MKLYRQIMAKYDPKGNAERPAQHLRRLEGVDDRAGAEGGWEEPDAGRSDEGGAQHGVHDEAEEREPVPPARRRTSTPRATTSTRSRRSMLVQYKNNVFQPIGKLINGRGA